MARMREILLVLAWMSFGIGFPATELQAAGGAPIALSSTLLKVGARSRTATVSVANRTDTNQRYRVSVIDMVMTPNGKVRPLAEGEQGHSRSAKDWVIATPSSISLPPGGSQNIRLLIRRPKGLTDGEYRAHLMVSQEPPADIAGGLKEDRGGKQSGLELNIVTIYSTTIPVVIQQGEQRSGASITKAHFDGEGKNLILGLKREGNASFRGFVMLQNEGSADAVLPITIYPEIDDLEHNYPVSVGEPAGAEVKLSLYSGEVPRPGEPLTAELLESRVLALP